MGRQYCIVDLEATGGNYKQSRVMDVAAYVFDGEKVVEKYASLVNPEKPIDPYVKKLTGITDEMVAEAPTFTEIAGELRALMQDRLFVAHNVHFDYNLLLTEYRRLGQKLALDRFCTLDLSRKYVPELDSHSLGNVAKHLGFAINGRHRAAGDALATLKLLQHLLIDTEAGDKLEHFIISKKVADFELKDSKISHDTIDSLPETPGLTWLLGDKQEPLYVSRSASIREKAIKLLQGKGGGKKLQQRLQQVHDVQYEETGSELMAELRYYQCVFQNKPIYNENTKQLHYRYAIGHAKTKGLRYVGIFPVGKKGTKALAYFKDYKSAEKQLRKWASKCKLRKYQLHFDVKHRKIVPEGLLHRLPLAEANARIEDLLTRISPFPGEYLVVDEGSDPSKKKVIWVKEGSLMGWCSLPSDDLVDPTAVREQIQANSVVEGVKIVERFLRQDPKYKLVEI